jgi:hypothetical protein
VLIKSPETALGYVYDGTGTGFNSGPFVDSPGGVGWHMTIVEILDVVRALRQGQIVNGILAQTILNQSWGLNSPLFGADTDTGRVFYKSGKWTTDQNNPDTAKTEQCFVMMAPDDTEIVVFVNSEITNSGVNLRQLVQSIYENNIVIVP